MENIQKLTYFASDQEKTGFLILTPVYSLNNLISSTLFRLF